MELTAVDVSYAVARRHFTPVRDIIIPNCVGMTGFESDLLVCRRSGWLTEVEIKVSKADFRREFAEKGHKHKMLELGCPTHDTRSLDKGPCDSTVRNIAEGLGCALDEAMDEWYKAHTWDWSACSPWIVRHFYFAMPDYLADGLASEIPVWAGLLSIDRWRYVHKIKEAPKLNARKLTDAERSKLLWYAHARYWDKTQPLGAFR